MMRKIKPSDIIVECSKCNKCEFCKFKDIKCIEGFSYIVPSSLSILMHLLSIDSEVLEAIIKDKEIYFDEF